MRDGAVDGREIDWEYAMDVSRRALSVLCAIVELYIRTGEPVASRQVARHCGLGLSPATMRNIMAELEKRLEGVKKPVKIAVLGCVVNGPGEARIADLGVACDANGAMLFVRGKPVRRVASSEITKCLVHEIEKELEKR